MGCRRYGRACFGSLHWALRSIIASNIGRLGSNHTVCEALRVVFIIIKVKIPKPPSIEANK